jgi:hypothetical protein
VRIRVDGIHYLKVGKTVSLLAASVKTSWPAWKLESARRALQRSREMATRSSSWSPVLAVWSEDCLLRCGLQLEEAVGEGPAEEVGSRPTCDVKWMRLCTWEGTAADWQQTF